VPPLLRVLVRARLRRAASEEAASRRALTERLAGLAPDERRAFLLALVTKEIATVFALPSPQAVDPTAALKDLGLDSLMAVELRNRLVGLAGVDLAPTVVFDHPTALALAEKLAAELHEEGASVDAKGRSGSPAVPDEIAKLDAVLVGIEDAPNRKRVLDHLRALVSKWSRADEPVPTSERAEDFADATERAQLIELLEQELSRPSGDSHV
jgi:acyl carrier protein